jgi:hypothetical protein
MLLPLDRKIFEIMLEVKCDALEPIIKQYDTDRQSLYQLLWKEFNIPGMEIRIANTALDFLIDCCEKKRDLEDGLRGEIKKNILAAGIFYTNIAPEAMNITDFNG